MSEPRSTITWDELAEGEASIELARKIEDSMPRAAADGKRMEIEARGAPNGGKDTQVFTRTIDPSSQPPTPVGVILDAIVREFRSGLDEDWIGRIRINFREKGNSRNVYTSFSRNIHPGEDDEDLDEDVFDDDEVDFSDAPPARGIPHIPMQQGPYQPRQDYQGNWQPPPHLPAVDMRGTGHVGPSAYERRRMSARDVGLNEPLAEFLMAPQWASIVDMMGGHNDRLMRMNLELVGGMKEVFMRQSDIVENLVTRVLDNHAPRHEIMSGQQQQQANDALSVGVKLMKMLKKSGDRGSQGSQAPSPTPAWGGTPSASSGERAGDWQRGALNIPETDPSEWGDLDDDEDSDFDLPEPAPRRPSGSGGGGAARAMPHAPPAGLLSADDIGAQVKVLAKSNPSAVKSMVLGIKDELAEALEIDKDMLDAFLDE